MSNVSAAARPAASHLPWLIIACGCVIAAMTFGPRSAMGFFQLPMLAEKGWDRTTFGLAMALQNLFWGAGLPFFGAIADRYGTWRVLALSGIIYAAGLFLMATATTPTMLHIGGGVLVGLGVAAGGFGIVLAAFARHVPAERRSLVFGIGTAAGSAGMFIFAPISQGLITAYGWSDTLIIMSAAMLLIPIIAIPLAGNSKSGTVSQVEIEQSVGQALREALGHQSFLLLTSGFFVCGFQVAFITAHFPAYIGDIGIEARYAVIALALIGFFNIIGSLASGFIGQRYSKPIFLAWIYIGRSVVVTAFLLFPQTPTTVILFAIAMGLLWLSTVPPTNALVAIMFGTRHLGMLGGVVFFSHQIGSFLGVWLGGYLYDRFGSYDGVWWLGVALGLFAAVVHWPIAERPVVRPALVPAQ
ncbi:Predicted arabinose efflux permease, MFS family [Mesorhizobium albiziae]|uniref:Predicted arabinose efflux permease, MFS family n=1 Tax=Neomesorhizobium albiziae TaxID=335020 RepID=A0A1I4APF8_9HYPH|nr:MFS transporter [Mesorhizobium albiziae]GLS33002.1 MFS transporter [Mesorhizobium albiziae]SFK58398.1 Predicted arabinose efflux permease, MFS family [Mesorhizobium albiziae]